MKALLVFALIATVSGSLFSLEVEQAVDPYDFFKGFLKAIGDKDDIKDLLVCLNKLEPIKEEIRAALKLIFTLDNEKVLEGIKKFTTGLKKGYDVLVPCIDKYPKLKNLVGRIINANTLVIGYRIIANMAKYKALVIKIKDCLNVDDLMCVGTNAGLLLKSIYVEGMSEVVEVAEGNDLLEFLKGFLKGIGDQGDPQKLLKCINTLDEVIQKIKQGLLYITSGNLDEIIKGVTMLLEAVREMLAKIKPCIEGLEVLKKLWEAIISMDIAKVLKKVLLNLNRIVSEVTFTYKCFSDGDFNCAGFGIGNLLKFFFLTN